MDTKIKRMNIKEQKVKKSQNFAIATNLYYGEQESPQKRYLMDIETHTRHKASKRTFLLITMKDKKN